VRARDGLARLLRAGRRWRTGAPGCNPGWSPPAACEADGTAPAPGFTAADRRRLDQLAQWWESAGEGARLKGADLAEHLRDELPDIPASVAARVLLHAGRHIGDAANAEEDDRDALRVIADALQAAPTVLADMAAITEDFTGLAEERPWR
jgi:hypothetical protein